MALVNAAGENVAIHYPSSSVSILPTVSAIKANSTVDNGNEETQFFQAPATQIKEEIYTSVTGADQNITEYKKVNTYEVSSMVSYNIATVRCRHR